MRRFSKREDAVQTANVVVLLIALAIVAGAVAIRFAFKPAEHHHGDHDDHGQDFRWETNETLDRVVVLEGGGHRWSDVTVTLVSCSSAAPNTTVVHMGRAFPYPNEEANASGAALNARSSQPGGCGPAEGVEPGPDAATVAPGDFLSFCVSGTSSPALEVRIRFTHEATDFGTAAFADIRPCPGS